MCNCITMMEYKSDEKRKNMENFNENYCHYIDYLQQRQKKKTQEDLIKTS